ncbi:hypothetical protein MMC26_005307 [Xylographa opegraphella]|nr:hypothetical protein [Xylographa opegraphella]
MKAPFPSYTAEWHQNTYATIDPQRPELSAKGKSIIVTGAGSGIGRATVIAFAVAGASRFALLGRTIGTLEETKRIIEADYPETDCTTYAVDVADEIAVHKSALDFGTWDVLILNAGKALTPTPIVDTNVLDWWNVMEVKLLEHVAAENPDVFVVSVHPGVVKTAIVGDSQLQTNDFVFDDVNLPAHFNVWVTSSEAKFLRGKFVWANWSVPEMMARSKEIEETPVLTSNILGWPFQRTEMS